MLARPLVRTAATPFSSAGSGVLTPGSISTITDDTKYNAFPSICRLSNGDLLLAYMKSDTPGNDNTGKIVGKMSADDGASWGSEFTMADAALGCLNPGLIALQSGRVVLTFNLFDFPDTPVDAVRVIYTDDAQLGAAATWSALYTVNSSMTGWCAAGTSRPALLVDGRVAIAVYGLDSGETFASSHVLFSSDEGATFSGEVVIADGEADGRDYFEPSLLRLGIGLLCQMRTTSGSGSMYQNHAPSTGATWSASASAFGGYAPSNLYQRGTRTLVATVRGNAAGKVQAFTSTDLGASWDDQGILDATSYTISNYAAFIDKLDGTGLVVYAVETATNNSDIKQVLVTEGAA